MKKDKTNSLNKEINPKEIKNNTAKKVLMETEKIGKAAEIKVRINKELEVQYIYNDGKIVVLEKGSTYMMWFRDIIVIEIDETQNNTIKFVCINDRVVDVNGTLLEIEDILDYSDFIVTHRGYIANMLHAEKLVKGDDSGVLYLIEKKTAKVSKGHYEMVEKSIHGGARSIKMKDNKKGKKGK